MSLAIFIYFLFISYCLWFYWFILVGSNLNGRSSTVYFAMISQPMISVIPQEKFWPTRCYSAWSLPCSMLISLGRWPKIPRYRMLKFTISSFVCFRVQPRNILSKWVLVVKLARSFFNERGWGGYIGTDPSWKSYYGNVALFVSDFVL
jgi:hypothetical protein